MTLLQLFLIHRYKIVSVHYVTPTDNNLMQLNKMKDLGIFEEVHTEIGYIIVASVKSKSIADFTNSDGGKLEMLISKSGELAAR